MGGPASGVGRCLRLTFWLTFFFQIFMLHLLLNCWTESNQIWFVASLHEWGVQEHIYFWPAPMGPGEGSKGQITVKFNYKVNFKNFHVHIERDFGCDSWVMHSLVAYQIKSDDEKTIKQLKFLPKGPPRGPGEGSKGQITIKFNYKDNFKNVYVLHIYSVMIECITYWNGFWLWLPVMP